MIDHVAIEVRHTSRATHFYDAALEPLGYKCLSQDAKWLGYGRDAIAVRHDLLGPRDDQSRRKET
jgi:hypothetical protein